MNPLLTKEGARGRLLTRHCKTSSDPSFVRRGTLDERFIGSRRLPLAPYQGAPGCCGLEASLSLDTPPQRRRLLGMNGLSSATPIATHYTRKAFSWTASAIVPVPELPKVHLAPAEVVRDFAIIAKPRPSTSFSQAAPFVSPLPSIGLMLVAGLAGGRIGVRLGSRVSKLVTQRKPAQGSRRKDAATLGYGT